MCGIGPTFGSGDYSSIEGKTKHRARGDEVAIDRRDSRDGEGDNPGQ
jgi:hypothetical protein